MGKVDLEDEDIKNQRERIAALEDSVANLQKLIASGDIGKRYWPDPPDELLEKDLRELEHAREQLDAKTARVKTRELRAMLDVLESRVGEDAMARDVVGLMHSAAEEATAEAKERELHERIVMALDAATWLCAGGAAIAGSVEAEAEFVVHRLCAELPLVPKTSTEDAIAAVAEVIKPRVGGHERETTSRVEATERAFRSLGHPLTRSQIARVRGRINKVFVLPWHPAVKRPVKLPDP